MVTSVAQKDYSATPLWRKLGIKPGSALRVINPPPEFSIPDLPDGVRRTRTDVDVILQFATRAAKLGAAFGQLAEAITTDGGLWIAWPKKTSSITHDLSFELVQGIGLDAGLVDNKSCAIDADWQAMRFVYRLADRPMRR